MSSYLTRLAIGTPLFVAGLLFFVPYLKTSGEKGPFILVAAMWLSLFLSLGLWQRPSWLAFKNAFFASTAICAPILAYMLNQWLGYGVGVVVFIMAFRLAEKLKNNNKPSS